jgi:glycosyltransferase involved in cell wall biosynthesis
VDPARFFPEIDALVVPSVWEEPLGRVIHEAMAFGVPSIASRIGGIPEIVEDDVTGYLFEAGDATALAALIHRLTDGGLPAARLAVSCRRRSAAFRPEVIFDRYFDAFARAAAA